MLRCIYRLGGRIALCPYKTPMIIINKQALLLYGRDVSVLTDAHTDRNKKGTLEAFPFL